MACLDLEGRDCLVVGAGAVGVEKAQGLIECGARRDDKMWAFLALDAAQ